MISKLNCDICTNTYQSSGEYQPTVLIQCGHGLCRSCANTMDEKIVGDIAEGKKIRCPFCRTISDRTVKNWDLVAIISGCVTQKALVEKLVKEDATAQLRSMLESDITSMNDTDRVLKLLDNGADPNIKADSLFSDCTLLCFVLNYQDHVWAEKIKIAEKLISLGANVNGTNCHGETALVEATEKEDALALNFLLLKDADPALASPKGTSPLYRAVVRGQIGNVKYLVDVLNKKHLSLDQIFLPVGYTPLMLAAHLGDVTAATILVKGGACINLCCNKGKTAFDIAKKYGHDKIVALLSNSGI